MVDLAALLHEISVAFAASTNLRTLLPRLATGMARHLPVVELQSAALDPSGERTDIAAYAPVSERRWDGQRSARFFERQWIQFQEIATAQTGIRGAAWCVEIEPARVAVSPIESCLKLSVGRRGLLSVALKTDISVIMESENNTEILVNSLVGHCLRLGQLDASARACRLAHRNNGDTQAAIEGADRQDTGISVIENPLNITDISVMTIDKALVQCISSALHVTSGKIYGEGGAAKLLGLKPSTLQSKMRKLGIERSQFV